MGSAVSPDGARRDLTLYILAVIALIGAILGLGFSSAWASAWKNASRSASSETAVAVLTKEEAIDRWFRQQVDNAYGVEIVGSHTARVVTARYQEKERSGEFASREAVFHFDKYGNLFAVQGDTVIRPPTGQIAAR